MIILAGPSASGKTEVGRILSINYGIKKLITYTTREMRIGEVDGKDYNFVSKEKFGELMSKDLFFETVSYANNFYGTLKSDIQNNKYVIVEAEGLLKYQSSDYFTVSFFLDLDEEIRIERMKNRGDNISDINVRIEFDRKHFNENIIKTVDYHLYLKEETPKEIADIVYKKYSERKILYESNGNT